MLSKRAFRCLKRIDAGQSIPDIGAMDEIEKKGFIVCLIEDGEIEINETEKTKQLLGEDFIGARYRS